MPQQDAQGRWVSDDGRLWWDGAAWRPLGAGPALRAERGSPVPYYIGMGCALVLLVLVLMAVCTTVIAQHSGLSASPSP